MTITQTVEIPADHRLTIDVPSEIPAGPVVLTFTPAVSGSAVARELVDPGPHPDGVDEVMAELSMAALDAFEEDLKRATPQMLALLRDTTVTFSMADLVKDPEQRGKESGS